MKRVLLIAALALGGAGPGRAETSPRLTVEVSGFRSDEGQLLLRLYGSEAGFPTDGSKALRQTAQPIKNGRAVIIFEGLSSGSYAIGCVHDQNGNGKLDTNLIGIPREGVCASNDAQGRRGPPKWSDARFALQADTTLSIHVHYR
jgi:uncharacterized protein (DUF2141 family)